MSSLFEVIVGKSIPEEGTSKCFTKRQQMQWSPKGAHLLLQMRTRVLNDELEQMFRNWYPGFRAANDEKLKKVA